jgi:hypothetical protein
MPQPSPQRCGQSVKSPSIRRRSDVDSSTPWVRDRAPTEAPSPPPDRTSPRPVPHPPARSGRACAPQTPGALRTSDRQRTQRATELRHPCPKQVLTPPPAPPPLRTAPRGAAPHPCHLPQCRLERCRTPRCRTPRCRTPRCRTPRCRTPRTGPTQALELRRRSRGSSPESCPHSTTPVHHEQPPRTALGRPSKVQASPIEAPAAASKSRQASSSRLALPTVNGHRAATTVDPYRQEIPTLRPPQAAPKKMLNCLGGRLGQFSSARAGRRARWRPGPLRPARRSLRG